MLFRLLEILLEIPRRMCEQDYLTCETVQAGSMELGGIRVEQLISAILKTPHGIQMSQWN